MSLRSLAFSMALVGLLATASHAQIPQVVQLPTFSFFTVSTTVSVPDSGRGFMGGVRRARYRSTSRGVPGASKLPGAGRLFASRGSGSSVSSSGVSATATIIDHREMDEALLSEAGAARPRGTALTETDRKALVLSSHVAKPAEEGLRLGTPGSGASVAEIRAAGAAAARRHEAELHAYLVRGQQAEAAGRFGAARCCYHVVVRKAKGALREQAAARLAAIEAAEKAALQATEKKLSSNKSPSS